MLAVKGKDQSVREMFHGSRGWIEIATKRVCYLLPPDLEAYARGHTDTICPHRLGWVLLARHARRQLCAPEKLVWPCIGKGAWVTFAHVSEGRLEPSEAKALSLATIKSARLAARISRWFFRR